MIPLWLLNLAGLPLKALKEYPWQCGCAALAVATVWLYNGKADEVAGRAQDRAAYEKAQEAAKNAAVAARQKYEQEYKTNADKSQAAHEASEAGLRSIADRALERLRAESLARLAGRAGTSTKGGSPGIPEKVPAETELGAGQSVPVGFVLIPESDVTACTLTYGYAVDAAKWAATLKK